ALVDVRHLHARGLRRDRVLRLLLRAHEEHRPSALGESPGVRLCLGQTLERLLEIDDVDAAAVAEDEPLHLRIPAARLGPEVDTCLEQVSHRNSGHVLPPWFQFLYPAEPDRTGAKHRHPCPTHPAGSWV